MRARWIAITAPMAVGLAVALASCMDPRMHEPGDWNVPVVAATGNGVAFTVSAYQFTFDASYGGIRQADSMAVGLVVSGYGGGSAQIEIVDSSGVQQLQVPVTQNVVEATGQSMVHGTPPFTVHVQFTGFSGVFVLGVGVRTPAVPGG